MRKFLLLIAIVFVAGCGGKTVAPPPSLQSQEMMTQQQASFKRLENQIQQIQQAVSTLSPLQHTEPQTTRLEADLRRHQEDISQKFEALQNLITNALPSSPPPQGQVPSTPSIEDQMSLDIAVRWSQAVEKWSSPERNHRYYRGPGRTHCDLFARDVFSDCEIDAFNNRSINDLHAHLTKQWDPLGDEEAAERAAKGHPTVAITMKGQPPGSHIAILLGGLDGRGRPQVRGAGASSGPKDQSFPQNPKTQIPRRYL